MSITELKKQIAELKNTDKLHRYVINDIIADSEDYPGNYVEDYN